MQVHEPGRIFYMNCGCAWGEHCFNMEKEFSIVGKEADFFSSSLQNMIILRMTPFLWWYTLRPGLLVNLKKKH